MFQVALREKHAMSSRQSLSWVADIARATVCMQKRGTVRLALLLLQVGVLLAFRVDTAQLFRRRGHVLTAIEYCSGAQGRESLQ